MCFSMLIDDQQRDCVCENDMKEGLAMARRGKEGKERTSARGESKEGLIRHTHTHSQRAEVGSC